MDKTVLITGASSGIGNACALRFAAAGWRVILFGRRLERMKALAKEIGLLYGTQSLVLQVDVRNQLEVERAIEDLGEDWKSIDVLINNAGLAVGLHPIHEGVLDDWERMIDTNVKGLLYVTRAVSVLMVERKQGHIVNIGSIAGKEAYPKGNVYCATKFAVDGLTAGMRMDLAQHKIKVSQVAPGAINTEFSLVRFKGDQDRADQVYTGFKPLSGEDVAEVVFFMVNLPGHVNISDLVLLPTAQPSATQIIREG